MFFSFQKAKLNPEVEEMMSKINISVNTWASNFNDIRSMNTSAAVPITSTPTVVEDDNSTQITNTEIFVQSFQKAASYREVWLKHIRISEAILYFISADMKPLAVVKGNGFIRLVKKLASTYQIRFPSTFKRRLNEKYGTISNLFCFR